MTKQVSSTQLPVTISNDFFEVFVDGPMSVANINTIAAITMTRVRPKTEAAVQGTMTEFQVEAVCRVTMPVHILKDMADMLAKHQLVTTPAAGWA
jgi:hypothetical protein